METQSNRIMMREKLGFSGILKSALTIPYKSPSFLIFAFTTSLPLFFTLLLHDIIVQRSLIEASAAMRSLSFGYTIQFHFPSSVYFYDWSSPLETAGRLARSMSHRIIQLGLLRLVPLHLFYLLNTIAVVHSASLIYSGETPVSLKEMLQIPNSRAGVRLMRGPLITSIYVFLMSSLTFLALIWLVTYYFFFAAESVICDIFFKLLGGVFSIALFVKWLDWTTIWNMSIVISILEERRGIETLEASVYFSRGSRQRGLLLTTVFFVWSFCIMVSGQYMAGHGKLGGILSTSMLVSLGCLVNTVKWIVCMVYYYDCKKRILEKKIDVEEGREVETN